jgi:hypothetical protein
MDAEGEMRLCTSCATWRPVDEFRLRRKGTGKRHHQCAGCAAAYMREWRAERRLRAVGYALRHIRRYRAEAPLQGENLAALLVAGFGGAAGFFKTYRQALDAAQAAGDRRAVRKLLMGVFDFLTAAEMSAGRRAMRWQQQRLEREARRRAARWNEESEVSMGRSSW